MADLSLKLTAFEGPLDLLLHLIERDKVDIYDIPIAAVTEQYISYLRSMSEFDMEVASDFLVMAATLLQIKSRMLLPKQSAESEEEEADPRQQLVEMLVEYRRIKRAAAALADMKQSADLYWQREPMFGNLVERTVAPCTVQQLLKALAGMTTAPDGKPDEADDKGDQSRKHKYRPVFTNGFLHDIPPDGAVRKKKGGGRTHRPPPTLVLMGALGQWLSRWPACIPWPSRPQMR